MSKNFRFYRFSEIDFVGLFALLPQITRSLLSGQYRSGHIAGAISLPLHELQNRLAELPRDQDIVAYCRGPYCVLAAQAVELLQEHGFWVMRLEDGVSDWRARGLPVAVGDKAF